MDETNKITIGFTLNNEYGDTYSATSTAEVFNDLGETDLDFIGEKLNAFLSQCGYYRKNNLIFMEDVNEEEYDALADFLEDFRRDKKEVQG